MAWLRQEGPVSAVQYAKAKHLSERTALRDLTELVKRGLATRIGIRRGARYRAI
jgi:Fic family protein